MKLHVTLLLLCFAQTANAQNRILKSTPYNGSSMWLVGASTEGVEPDVDAGVALPPAYSFNAIAEVSGNNPLRSARGFLTGSRSVAWTASTANNDSSVGVTARHDIFPGNMATTNVLATLYQEQETEVVLKQPAEKVYYRFNLATTWNHISGPPDSILGNHNLLILASNGPMWINCRWNEDQNRWEIIKSWKQETQYLTGFVQNSVWVGNYRSPTGVIRTSTQILDYASSENDPPATILQTIGSNNPGHPGEDQRNDEATIAIQNRITAVQ